MKPPTLYLLQNLNAGYCGNSPLFWKEGGSGYTPNIDEAKRWTWKECQTEIRATKSSHSWNAWKLADCEAAVIRVVDIQLLVKP